MFCCALRFTTVLTVFVGPAPGTDWRGSEEEEFDVRVMLF